MKTSFAFFGLAAGANAFVPVAPVISSSSSAGVVAPSSSSVATRQQHQPMRMGLNPELAANFPRDFVNVSCSGAFESFHATAEIFPRCWCSACLGFSCGGVAGAEAVRSQMYN